MATRSFTVYCDIPAADDATAVVRPTAKVVSSESFLDAYVTPTPSSSTTSLASTTEKENLDPVTGETSGAPASKKRKTSVLATKTIVAEKHEGKAGKTEGKKPHAASSSAKRKKDSKAGKKLSRRVSSGRLGIDENTAAEMDRLAQVDIESRCYELTVSPLADITQAFDADFDAALFLTSFTAEESAQFLKATSTEPKLRDYFSTSHSSGCVAPPASLAGASGSTIMLGTPERRHIYSAFTFTTPSPSSERYNKANSRSASPIITPLDLSLFTTA